MKNSPIFIIASERSGSNLLRTLLGNHSNIEGAIAPHFYNSFWKNLHYYGDLREKNNMRNIFSDMVLLANHSYNNWELDLDFEAIYSKYVPKSFFDVFHLLYQEKALMENKGRYVCKGIHMFDYVFNVKTNCPEAKFIYLYRDPRDHVSSWMKNPLFLKTPYDAATKWNKEQTTCFNLKEAHNVNLFEVSYEGLISNTPQVMSNVLEYIGESIEEACFNTDSQRNKVTDWNKYWENLSKPVIKNNNKKYLKNLDNKEIKIVESITKNHMQKMDYELDTDAKWNTSSLYALQLLGQRELVRFKFRKHRRKDMERLQSKLQLLREIENNLGIENKRSLKSIVYRVVDLMNNL